MEPKGVPVKILVVPVFRRFWCFHAIEDVAAAQRVAHEAENIAWTKGANLEEKIALLGTKISSIVHGKIVKNWKMLESAKDGTIRNRIFRLAQAVLSKEDSQETFLKAVPSKVSDVEIIYPSSLKEGLVRRRMRAIIKSSIYRLQCRRAIWTGISIPLVPLLATPIPAFPVYYTGWKAYSNFKALAGARTLNSSFHVLDTMEVERLKNELSQLQESGVVFPKNSWPANLLARSPRYLDLLESAEIKMMKFYKKLDPAKIVPRMTPSDDLDRFTAPAERNESALGDEAVQKITKKFGTQFLLAHIARARKEATGSPFPTQLRNLEKQDSMMKNANRVI